MPIYFCAGLQHRAPVKKTVLAVTVEIPVVQNAPRPWCTNLTKSTPLQGSADASTIAKHIFIPYVEAQFWQHHRATQLVLPPGQQPSFAVKKEDEKRLRCVKVHRTLFNSSPRYVQCWKFT